MAICLSRRKVCQSVSLSVCLSACVSVYLFVCRFVCLSMCLSVCLSACLSVCLSVYLSVCLFVCQSCCLSVCLSVCLSACKCIPNCLLTCVNLKMMPRQLDCGRCAYIKKYSQEHCTDTLHAKSRQHRRHCGDCTSNSRGPLTLLLKRGPCPGNISMLHNIKCTSTGLEHTRMQAWYQLVSVQVLCFSLP